MLSLACLLLNPVAIHAAESTDFPKAMQVAAVSATVRVVNVENQSGGSGVIVGRKGRFVYVLTAYHVAGETGRLEVATFAEKASPKAPRVYPAVRLVARAGGVRDLALLRVVTTDPMPAPLSLCPARLLPDGKEGFKALSVGCAGGEAPTCLVEEVVGKRRVRRTGAGQPADCWEVGRKQQVGRSGGPLVDRRGYLLGVCSGTNEGKSYFCHTDEARAFLKESGFDWLN